MNPPEQPAYTETVSAEARAALTPSLDLPSPQRMPSADMRAFARQMQDMIVERRGWNGVTETQAVLGGVPVLVFARPNVPTAPRRILINLHGGGFEVDAGSHTECIPLAMRMDAAILAVQYRLAPEYPYPAAVDDALAVYKAALEMGSADRIGVFGASAGAVMTTQLLARIKHEGLPMPAAAGVFSGAGDLAKTGDCEAFLPPLLAGETVNQVISGYVGDADPADPLLSPLRGDLSGLPPTLLLTSTRDQLFSSTVILHRGLLKAGVAAELEVWDGLPHAFWSWLDCPETDEAFDAMADFFDRVLAR